MSEELFGKDDSQLAWRAAPIVKRRDGTFEIAHNGGSYQVCPKEIDPAGIYDFDDVSAFWNALSDDDPLKAAEGEPQAEIRRSEIISRLDAIDQERIRPLAAVALGQADDFDIQKLAELEEEAVGLRTELAAR